LSSRNINRLFTIYIIMMETQQIRNKVANIFFGSIIIAGLFMSYGAYVATGVFAKDHIAQVDEMVDDNLTDKRPTTRWRLNSNGYSQRYIELSGTNRVERMHSLLSNYGHDNYEARQTVARIHKIYPEMLICVAYADSSLGRFLKTKFNLGNVWNTDSGKTQAYETMEAGINAIGKVLNNRYLGQYNLVGQLSPFGNMNGSPYYATSKENWGINVLNCLWMIHNKQINNDWKFRR